MSFFTPDIPKLKASKDIAGLIKALKLKDSKISGEAAVALGELNASEAVHPLIDALMNEDKSIALAPCWALIRLANFSIPELIKIFRFHDFWIRNDVGGQIMHHLAPDLPATGTLNLGQHLSPDFLGNKVIPPRLKQFLTRFPVMGSYGQEINLATLLFVLIGPYAVPQLLDALKQDDETIKKGILETLHYMEWQPRTNEDKLTYWMACGQYQNCVSLGEMAVNPLLAELKDNLYHSDNSSKIAKALGELKCVQAIDLLTQLLTNCTYGGYVPAAAEALIRIGKPAAEALLAILEKPQTSASAHTKLACMKVLAQMNDPRALPHFLSLLSSEDENFSQSAADALDTMKWIPPQDSQGALYWSVRCKWDKCIAMGPVAIDALIKAIHHKHIHVRKPAAEALVAFYKSGNLSEADKQKILSVKKEIKKRHEDQTTYTQSDCSPHTDQGIGVSGFGWNLF